MLIGLGGKKGAGKNTVANLMEEWLRTNRGLKVYQLAFADALKNSFSALFNTNLATIEKYKNDPTPIVTPFGSFTVRELLQRYGTEAHRDVYGQDFWVDILNSKIEDLTTDASGFFLYAVDIIVTDVRFKNELAMFRDYPTDMYTTIWVDRPSADHEDTHTSESSVGKADFIDVIENYGDLYDLQEETAKFMEGFLASDLK